jgi:hypothetical protein
MKALRVAEHMIFVSDYVRCNCKGGELFFGGTVFMLTKKRNHQNSHL